MVFEDDITALLSAEGAKGHTVYESGGSDSFHLHPRHRSSLIDALHLMESVVIVLDAEGADRIAERLMVEYPTHQPGIVTLTEVQVFRPQKFYPLPQVQA